MPKIKNKSTVRPYHPEKQRLKLLNIIIHNYTEYGLYNPNEMMRFEENYLEIIQELATFSTIEEIDMFEQAVASHIAKMYVPSVHIVPKQDLHLITEHEDYIIENKGDL